MWRLFVTSVNTCMTAVSIHLDIIFTQMLTFHFDSSCGSLASVIAVQMCLHDGLQ